jgi:ssRNA-specific RNase YbeY (16S rRNA maturation enzyme)
MLHLLGYEHDEPAREREMRALEEKILGEILAKMVK